MSVNIMEAVQVSPLKGAQNSAQASFATLRRALGWLPASSDNLAATKALRSRGFNPGLGNSRRRALKGHQNPARHIGSKSLARVSSFSRHFQGAFLSDGYPGLKPRLRKAYVAAKLSDYAGSQPRARRSVAKEAWAKLFCPFGRTPNRESRISNS
jgi:hypothetical protein